MVDLSRVSSCSFSVNVNTCCEDDCLSFLDLGISWIGGLSNSLVSELLVTGSTLVEKLSGVTPLDGRVEIVTGGTGELGRYGGRQGCRARRDSRLRVIDLLFGEVVCLHHGQSAGKVGDAVIKVLGIELVFHDLERGVW